MSNGRPTADHFVASATIVREPPCLHENEELVATDPRDQTLSRAACAISAAPHDTISPVA
jgi:hypothetical protein